MWDIINPILAPLGASLVKQENSPLHRHRLPASHALLDYSAIPLKRLPARLVPQECLPIAEDSPNVFRVWLGQFPQRLVRLAAISARRDNSTTYQAPRFARRVPLEHF